MAQAHQEPPATGPARAADDATEGASDAELLRLHLAGDQQAFGTLFLRHKDRLWAVALRIVCDPDDAADALQEAMISAFRRAEQLPRRFRRHHLAAPDRGQRLA